MTPQTFDQWADKVLEANQDTLLSTKDLMRMAAEATIEAMEIFSDDADACQECSGADQLVEQQEELVNKWLGKNK